MAPFSTTRYPNAVLFRASHFARACGMHAPQEAQFHIVGQELSSQALALASRLLRLRPSATVAMFRVQPGDSTRTVSFKLLAFTESLRELADAPASRSNADLNVTFTHSPVFLNPDTAALYAQSSRACTSILESFLRRLSTRASTYKLIVSLTGRLKKVRADLWVVLHLQDGCEIIASYSALPPDFVFTSDLRPPIDYEDEHQDCPPPFRWREGEAFRRPKPELPPFVCAFCGATATSQRRYAVPTAGHAYRSRSRGPDGTGTLCNPCGLRWSKGRKSAS